MLIPMGQQSLLYFNTILVWIFVWHQPEIIHLTGVSNLIQLQLIFYPAIFGALLGAIHKKSSILKAYRIFLICTVLFQATYFLLWSLGYQHYFYAIDVAKVFEEFAQSPLDPVKQQIVDNIQQSFHCCGPRNARFWPRNKVPIPDSCHHPNYYDYIFQEGCSDAYMRFLVITQKYGTLGRFLAWGFPTMAAVNIYCIRNILKSIEADKEKKK